MRSANSVWNQGSAVGVLAVSLAGGLLVLAAREMQPEPEAADAPLARETERERV